MVRILISLYDRYLDPSEVGSLTLLVTRPLCRLNADHVYLRNCILCTVRFTTKLVLPVYFADSKGNWGIDPCLWPPCSPASHVSWLQLLARSLLTMSQLKLPTVLSFFFFFTTHCSYFITLLADHWVSRPLKVQLPTNQKMNDISLWSCFPKNSSFWLSFLKPLPYSSHPRESLQFMLKATFSDLKIISEENSL